MAGVVWHSRRMAAPEIRDLRPEDHDAVVALAPLLTTGVAPWRPVDDVATAVRTWLTDAVTDADPVDRPVLVAVVDGTVRGVVTGGTRRHWSGDVDAHIGELVVDPVSGGRGIGAALVKAMVDRARDRGHRRITLETGAANTVARAFYDGLGFEMEEVVLTRALDRPVGADGDDEHRDSARGGG